MDITDLEIRIAFQGNHAELRIPLSSLSVTVTGFNVDRVSIDWVAEEGPASVIVADLDWIEEQSRSGGPLAARFAAALLASRRSKRRPVMIVGGLIAGILGLAGLLWLALNPLAEWAVRRLPDNMEASIGAAAYRSLVDSTKVVESGPAVEAVHRIFDRMKAASPAAAGDLRVTVVRDTMVNAFALPGGHVVVMTGLIAAAESPEEVAAVIGHEIGHVTHRHAMKRMARQLGLTVLLGLILGDAGALESLAREVGLGLATNAYSREQETEADGAGLAMLREARVGPEGMVDFFERLDAVEPGLPAFLSSHPPSRERAEAARRAIRSTPAYEAAPFPLDWEAVRASLGAGEPRTP